MPDSQTAGPAERDIAAPADPPSDPPTTDPAVQPLSGAGAQRDPARAVVGRAIRIWLGHIVPLTLLSAIALSPLIAIAVRVHPPTDPAAARPVIQLGWMLLSVAWLGQLILVGGAAAVAAEPSQLRAFTRGLLQLIRGVVPCLVAALAVAVGGLALVVPGLVLLVLLSLTGASRERGLPAPLLDSIAAVRRQLPAVALAMVALFAIDAAIGLVCYRAFVATLPAKPTPTQLVAIREFVRGIALALVVLSPAPATVLAVLHARATQPR